MINFSSIENFSSQKIWERSESNPGLLGEKQECYLCAMQPPLSIIVNVLVPFLAQVVHLDVVVVHEHVGEGRIGLRRRQEPRLCLLFFAQHQRGKQPA